MDSTIKRQIRDLVKKSSAPLILIPENFDIDSASGAMGLYLFLENMKKIPSIACSAAIPEKFSCLADKKIIKNSIKGDCRYKISFDIRESRIKELSYLQEGNILQINLALAKNGFRLEKPRFNPSKLEYDLVFVVGSPDLGSLGKIYHDSACFFSETAVVNIDVHAENDKFGNVNLLRPDSSVSELIAETVDMISRENTDSRIADLLLTGIIAKINNFQSIKIEAETFAMVSVLLRMGANREEVVKRLTGINILASEKTEFYPPSKIIKQILYRTSGDGARFL